MPYTNLFIHAVWGTKNRYPYLVNNIRTTLISHIKENARTKGIIIDTLNGNTDHLHCLLRLDKEMSVSKAIQLIKGESSFWINKIKLTTKKFEWADEYYAASVSESLLTNVRSYIDNQEIHHRKVTFQEEYEQFIKSLQQD